MLWGRRRAAAQGLLRMYKRQMRKQAGRMLGIGDGANDVAMIQVRSHFWRMPRVAGMLAVELNTLGVC